MQYAQEAAQRRPGAQVYVSAYGRRYEVVPQLSLTLTNAVIVTASLSRELSPATGSIARVGLILGRITEFIRAAIVRTLYRRGDIAR